MIASGGTWAVIPSQVWSAAAPPQADEPNRGFLDALREKIHRWTESLWDPGKGGFPANAAIGVNLMSTTDVAWMRYAVNDPDLAGGHRDAWVRWLQQVQDPETGIVRYDPRDGGLVHSDGHALWQTVRGPEHPWRPVASFSALSSQRDDRQGAGGLVRRGRLGRRPVEPS